MINKNLKVQEVFVFKRKKGASVSARKEKMVHETDVLWQSWNVNKPRSDGSEVSKVEMELLECGKCLKILLWVTCVTRVS